MALVSDSGARLVELAERAHREQLDCRLVLASGVASVTLLKGAPREAQAAGASGLRALDSFIARAVAGDPAVWEDAAPALDSPAASITMSAAQFVRRIRHALASGGCAVRVGGDGLPTFPPLPRGAATVPGPGSLMRLLPRLETAALEIEAEQLRALVVCCEREIVDGYAEIGGAVASGPDILDQIGPAPGARLALYRLPAPLLRALPVYWRVPTNLNVGQARWIDAPSFVQSLARPGQRGVLCVLADDDLGLVFLDQAQVVGAYTVAAGRVGGLEEVAPLFADPTSVLLARLEEVPVAAPPPSRESPSPAQDEDLDPMAAPSWRRPFAGPVAAVPAAAVPGPSSADSPAAFLAQRRAAESQLLADVSRVVREELGDHAERVLHVFERAPQTAAGLLAAADEVEQMRLRLVSSETMRVVARRARQVLARS
jgi:hypothetical protein